jgi:excisionase family DNA binding protein
MSVLKSKWFVKLVLNMNTDTELLNVDEAAAYLRIKPPTVRAWILRRKIGVVRLGRSVRLRKNDLDLLIESGTTPAEPRKR